MSTDPAARRRRFGGILLDVEPIRRYVSPVAAVPPEAVL
jgi:hypothetical protein